jgi:hypothetical protein
VETITPNGRLRPAPDFNRANRTTKTQGANFQPRPVRHSLGDGGMNTDTRAKDKKRIETAKDTKNANNF